MKKLPAVLILMLLVVVLVLLFQYQAEEIIESVGRIVTRRGGSLNPLPSFGAKIDVYTGHSKTATLSHIDWGTCNPGGTKTYDAYMFNSGNVPLVLMLSTENWNPQNASNYIHLQWNYNNETIQPNMGISITFSLTIDSNIRGIDTFSFDIIIIF